MMGLDDHRRYNRTLNAPFCRTLLSEYISAKDYARAPQVSSPSRETCADGCRLVVGQREGRCVRYADIGVDTHTQVRVHMQLWVRIILSVRQMMLNEASINTVVTAARTAP